MKTCSAAACPVVPFGIGTCWRAMWCRSMVVSSI